MTQIVIDSDVNELRRREYPSIGDQLDVLWKLMRVLVDSGRIEDKDISDMLHEIESVKYAYPKR